MVAPERSGRIAGSAHVTTLFGFISLMGQRTSLKMLRIATGNRTIPPGQLPPRTIAPRAFSPGQFPPRTTAPRQLTPRTTPLPNNYPPDNSHLGKLPPNNCTRTISSQDNWPPGHLPPRTIPIRVIASRQLCRLKIFSCLSFRLCHNKIFYKHNMQNMIFSKHTTKQSKV